MPSKYTEETNATTPGPNLLEERSVGGILVHFVAIPTGVAGAGLVYLLATNGFTRRNARNALDWHLTVLALTVVTFGSLFTYAELTGQGAIDAVVLPSSATAVASIVVSALFTLWSAVILWSFLVGFIAMGKATFGTAWRYPLSPALVERFGSRVEFPGGWLLPILAYVVLTPLLIWGVFFGPTNGAAFFASAFGLLGLITVLTPLAGIAMYLHGERERPPDADWQPHVVAYVGVPLVIAVVGYVLSRTLTESVYPPGDAMYVFIAALWASSIVYLFRWQTTSK